MADPNQSPRRDQPAAPGDDCLRAAGSQSVYRQPDPVCRSHHQLCTHGGCAGELDRKPLSLADQDLLVYAPVASHRWRDDPDPDRLGNPSGGLSLVDLPDRQGLALSQRAAGHAELKFRFAPQLKTSYQQSIRLATQGKFLLFEKLDPVAQLRGFFKLEIGSRFQHPGTQALYLSAQILAGII